jgi:predicted AAA+ superfamily ATPase
MVDLKSETHSRIRGHILRLLSKYYPNFIDVVTLQGALDILGYPVPRDTLDSYTAYLEEIGALRLRIKKFGNMKTSQVMITVHGLKMVDGRESDSGVNVEP